TFRLDNLQGLSSVLIGDQIIEHVVNSTSIECLDVISSGPIPPNPAELLASNKMKEILTKAKGLYDIIIFDTPPILAVTDAQVIGNIVDGSIIVVRSRNTEIENAKKAKEALKSAQARLLGIVLNDIEKEANSNNYYYYGT